jgi:cation transport ATPase
VHVVDLKGCSSSADRPFLGMLAATCTHNTQAHMHTRTHTQKFSVRTTTDNCTQAHTHQSVHLLTSPHCHTTSHSHPNTHTHTHTHQQPHTNQERGRDRGRERGRERERQALVGTGCAVRQVLLTSGLEHAHRQGCSATHTLLLESVMRGRWERDMREGGDRHPPPHTHKHTPWTGSNRTHILII